MLVNPGIDSEKNATTDNVKQTNSIDLLKIDTGSSNLSWISGKNTTPTSSTDALNNNAKLAKNAAGNKKKPELGNGEDDENGPRKPELIFPYKPTILCQMRTEGV